MPYGKFRDGLVLTISGWLLSALSLLATVGYVWGQISGFGETPDLVLIGLYLIVILGAVLSYMGSRLLHRTILVAFPLIIAATIFTLIFVVLPSLVCFYRICIPPGSHP